MSAGPRFFYRAMVVGVALVSGLVEAAHADVFDDIGDLFSNAPEVSSSKACTSYAKAAVNISKGTEQNRCPLYAPRYSTNEQGHFQWCMSVTPETSTVEENARFFAFNACVGNQSFCNAYGDDAAKDARTNKLYNCGFSGPQWGANGEDHRSFCLSELIEKDANKITFNANGFLLSESIARSAAAAKCKARHSDQKIAFCNSYGLRSADFAKTFKEKKCNPSQNSSPRWSSDYDHHFSWCIGHGSLKATADAGNPEISFRERTVIACVARGGGPATIPAVVNRNSGAFDPAIKPVVTGVTTKVVPSSSAMDRLGGGIAVNPSAATRRGRPDMPCPTCGSNKVAPSGDIVRANPTTTLRPTMPTTLPAAPRPTVPDSNFNYGGCSGPCGVKETPLKQPK